MCYCYQLPNQREIKSLLQIAIFSYAFSNVLFFIIKPTKKNFTTFVRCLLGSKGISMGGGLLKAKPPPPAK